MNPIIEQFFSTARSIKSKFLSAIDTEQSLFERNRESAFLSVVLLALLITICGCGTPSPSVKTIIPTGSIMLTGTRQEKDGFAIAVVPVTNKEETIKYFGLDALKAGILILRMEATNQNPNTTLLLHKDNIKLLLGSDGEKRRDLAQGATVSSESIEAMAITGVLISPALLMVAAHQAANQSVVRHSLAANELPNQTLSIGQKAQGFLYYQLPKGKQFNGGTLEVSVTSTESHQTIKISVNINHE